MGTHHYAPDFESAAAVGLNAGMDQEGGGNKVIAQLEQAIKDKKTTPDKVATAFRRLMRIRIRLGMFDPPATVDYNKLQASSVGLSPEHLAVARTAALESMTLLKNAKARKRGKKKKKWSRNTRAVGG